MNHLHSFKIFEAEKYSKEHKERKALLSKAIKKSEDWSDPELMYSSVNQGKKAEDKAYKMARELGEIRVYRVVGLKGIQRTVNSNSELACSTSKSTSLAIGINNNDLVLSGKGEVMTYYDRDVSTNIIDKRSKHKLPITPLNKKSEYDEVLVVGKDIEWDVLYYNPESISKKKIKSELGDSDIKIVSIRSKGVPKLIKRSFEKEPLNESVEDQNKLRMIYGDDVIDECEEVIHGIKIKTFDLDELGFEIKIGYVYTTLAGRDKSPKMELEIFGKDSLFDENYDKWVLPTLSDVKQYVGSFGFSTGGHLTDPGVMFAGHTQFMSYKLLIQK